METLPLAEPPEVTGKAGTPEHRGFVGPVEFFDVFSAVQFNLLTHLGLRENHSLLDIGCGSLRAGRLFIPYLLPGGYAGIEPERWLVDKGIREEVGEDLIRLKRPIFVFDGSFGFAAFGRPFDYLLAHSIFSHATALQIRQCLVEARKVMHPRSLFAATFVEGDTDYSGATWALWAQYTFDFIGRAAEDAGLVCRRVPWPSPDLQQWVVFHLPGSPSTACLELLSGGDANLRMELNFCRTRLDRLQRHPYVKFGLGLNRVLKWLGFAVARLRRAAGPSDVRR